MPRKVCKKCMIFVEGAECPICKSKSFSESWNGRVFIMDVNKSEIGKSMGINAKGEYAIKAR